MGMTAQKERTGAQCMAAEEGMGRPPAGLLRYEDPLDADRADDVAVLATRRSICRVALIASEAGARFQRESAACDPMAWMLAPRRLFGGGAAIEACLDLDHFSRALILHGLGIGMDAEPTDIDGLLDGGGGDDGDDRDDVQSYEDDFDESASSLVMSLPGKTSPRGAGSARSRTVGGGGTVSGGGPVPEGVFTATDRRRLYSATIAYQASGLDLVAFHASFAHGLDEVFERLHDRFGGEATSAAQVRVGFDARHPLLPAMMAEMLREAEGWPDDGRSIDLDVNFERRVRI